MKHIVGTQDCIRLDGCMSNLRMRAGKHYAEFELHQSYRSNETTFFAIFQRDRDTWEYFWELEVLKSVGCSDLANT